MLLLIVKPLTPATETPRVHPVMEFPVIVSPVPPGLKTVFRPIAPAGKPGALRTFDEMVML